ncbi:olfactory receptor 2AG1-like [Stegastes partitus]|uniref:Olfactory receptor 2AG1-like n=1 Tax=Stegastes partitus TaxID=144197 RepID=A0A9Y4MZC5_9TELE|nr:PREDICTED: olfactory receptor 2AG1-like [Stegastes partitus]
MSDAAQTQTNITNGMRLSDKLLFSFLTTLPSCIFFFINGTLLVTLRSKPMFCGNCRYVLLCNLLIGDILFLALSQLLYLLSISRITMLYPVCALLIMLSTLTDSISPLTLVVMSMERYIAVCHPLRHAAIVTIRNTSVVILLIWTFCFLNVLIQTLLLLTFILEALQRKELCLAALQYPTPTSREYSKAYTCVLFVSTAVVIISTYTGVAAAARSASADKASAQKARNTLLLHLVQLGLSLSSTTHSFLVLSVSKLVTRMVFVRIQNVLYVFLFVLPRCLSALIYGIRDQSIRSILVYKLCFKKQQIHF